MKLGFVTSIIQLQITFVDYLEEVYGELCVLVRVEVVCDQHHGVNALVTVYAVV